MSSFESLQKALGLSFRDPSLLSVALTHTSYAHEQAGASTPHQERMEYLGDAVLSLVVAEEVFRRFPDEDEGGLTELRSHIVSGKTLTIWAREWGLGEYLLLGVGEDATGGRDRASNLADAVEALLGAVFLDRGISAVRKLLKPLLRRELGMLDDGGDPKGRLQALLQREGKAAPKYKLEKKEGPEHAPIFVVKVIIGRRALGTGRGRRKKDAEKEAARHALLKVSLAR